MSMNFELDLLPVTSGAYSLGSSAKKWNIYAASLNGVRSTSTFSITTSNWSGSGPYTYSLSNSGITANSAVSADLGNTYKYLSSNLEIAPSAGAAVFTTAVKPSGTIAGTIEIINLN